MNFESFESGFARNWINVMEESLEEFSARKMLEFFQAEAEKYQGLKAVVKSAEIYWWHEPADVSEHTPLSTRQMRVGENVVGGWVHVEFTRTQLYLDMVTMSRKNCGGELTIILFGKPLVRLLVLENDKPKLLTVEGFYELLRDESLATIIASLIHDASRDLLRLATGHDDPKGSEGGPAYRFADWILGPRGEGKEFELSGDELARLKALVQELGEKSTVAPEVALNTANLNPRYQPNQ